MGKTAIVIGATGLVGGQLTKVLLQDSSYGNVKVFVRRTTGIENPKLEEHQVDFEDVLNWADRVTGDQLFSTMGTTIKQAKSKEAQYRVDFTYQYAVARAASQNGVEDYVLVSSAGANHKSKFFYPRLKGELEQEISTLRFRRTVIFRPSILVGERSEKRRAERLGIAIGEVLTRVVPPLRRYRPIPAAVVARAMINSVSGQARRGIEVVALDQIFALAQPPNKP